MECEGMSKEEVCIEELCEGEELISRTELKNRGFVKKTTVAEEIRKQALSSKTIFQRR
jgi:hypothetical protein